MRGTLLIVGGIVVLIGFLIIIPSTIISQNYPSKVTKGDCFDKFGSKINGVTCDVSAEDYPLSLNVALIVGFSLALIGVMLLFGYLLQMLAIIAGESR